MFVQNPIGVRTEFTAPDHERVVDQTARLQVPHEHRLGLHFVRTRPSSELSQRDSSNQPRVARHETTLGGSMARPPMNRLWPSTW